MSNPRIGRNASAIAITASRARQTPRVSSPFSEVLKGGADLLLSGAQAATRVVGLPTLSAAISRARAGAAVGADPGSVAGARQPSSDPTALLGQDMSDDLKLLELQRQIHRQNQQVALVSNVLKARHDTAKSAIGNIRA